MRVNQTRQKGNSWAIVCLIALLMTFVVMPISAQEATAEVEATNEVTTTTPVPTEETVVTEPAETPTDEASTAETPEAETTPEVEATLLPPVEVTEEAPITSVASDFEADTTGWALDGWGIVTENGETLNTFIKTTMPQSTASFTAFVSADVLITGRYRIDVGNVGTVTLRSGENALTIMFNSYGSSRLYIGDELVASAFLEVTEEEPDWFNFSITAVTDGVIVAVNGADAILYRGAMSLEEGTVIFASGATNTDAVSLDDVTLEALDAETFIMPVIPMPTPTPVPTEAPVVLVPDVTPEAEVTAEPEAEVTAEPEAEVTAEPEAEVTAEPEAEVTAEPEAEVTPEPEAEVTPEPQPELDLDALAIVDPASKVNASLLEIVALFEADDLTEAYRAVTELGLTIDEQARVRLIIWAQDTDAISEQITALGGVINASGRWDIDVFISLDAIMILADNPLVLMVELPLQASSTGPVGTNRVGGDFASFDILGLEDWHQAGIRGSGVNIAVIDRGFSGITTTGDLSCVGSTVIKTGTGATAIGNHGTQVMQVICDVAPDARVFGYVAQDATSLASAISQAIADGRRVIMIAIDLGAAASPGDGTLGDNSKVNDPANPYRQIQLAYNAGIPVIAAAGNNHNRYATINYAGAESIVTFAGASVGDRVNVSFGNWNNGPAKPGVSVTGAIAGSAGLQFNSFTVNSAGNVTVTIAGGGSNTTIQVQIASETASIFSLPGNAIAGGSLARPADSPFAIAVGAVEASSDANFPIDFNSSRGPVYTTNGAGVGTFANGIKPEIVSPTDVSISTGTLGGTSASAAHVAGMVAIIKSDIAAPNTNNTLFNANNSSAVNNIKTYLMTRAAEHFQSPDDPMDYTYNAIGFDFTYGAGMAVLGSPGYPFSRSLRQPDPAGNFQSGECTGNLIYVGQYNPNPASENGSLDFPFTHIMKGVNAVVHTTNDCVIVLPGEYVSPLLLENIAGIAHVRIIAYQEVTVEPPTLFNASAASFRIADSQYVNTSDTKASFIFANAIATAYTISGFGFTDAARYDNPGNPFGYAGNAQSPRAAYMLGANNITLRNNRFTGFRLFNDSIIETINSTNITITRNQFNDNQKINTVGGAMATALYSSGSTNIIFRNNQVNNNSNTGASNANATWASILYADVPAGGINTTIGAHPGVYIINNEFVNNQAETLVQLRTANTSDMRELIVFGNILLNNTTTSTEIGGNPSGPLFYLFYGKNFSLLSNTIVGNSALSSFNGGIVWRGNAAKTEDISLVGGLNGPDQRIAIYNNFLYNNILSKGLLWDDSSQPGGCATLPSSTGDAPVANNWFFNNTSGGDTPIAILGGGNDACGVAGNNNLTTNPVGQLRGDLAGGAINPQFPLYYALARTNPGTPLIDAEFSDGVDAGNTALSGFYGQDFAEFDLRGIPRVLDVTNIPPVVPAPATSLDIGAYELPQIRIIEGGNIDDPDDNPFEAPDFNEHVDASTPAFAIDILSYTAGDALPNVRDYFGNATVTLLSPLPTLFGTHCGTGFTNGVKVENNVILYCPPLHFYTNSVANQPWLDGITITYRAVDEDQSFADGRLKFSILPVNSSNLTTANDLRVVNAVPGQNFTDNPDPGALHVKPAITLQPRVTITNSVFRFIGLATPDQADYPYTYTYEGMSDPNGIIVGTPTIDDPSEPKISLEVLNTAELNLSADVQYRVTDSRGNFIINTLRITVVYDVPQRGLHDDSSRVWSYHAPDNSQPGGWLPFNNPLSINNTLHTSLNINDYAQFSFAGTGFVLYMWYEPGGADWTLLINDDAPLSPWTLKAGSALVYENTIGGFECSTRAIPSRINPLQLSNNGRNGYTVTCDGMTAVEHNVKVVNSTGRRLSVDAFSVLNSTSATVPRFSAGSHDADSQLFRDMFGAGWEEFRNPRATNGVTYRTTPLLVGTAPQSVSDISFEFIGGTGFALGTVHDRTNVTYDICVRHVEDTEGVCQSFSNAPDGIRTRLDFNVYRPFYGFSPNGTYRVDIKNIQLLEDRSFFYIDDIVIFPETLTPTDTLPYGTTDASAFDYFVLGGGVKDNWVFDFNLTRLPSNSVINMNRVTNAGPFLAFEVPTDADEFYWAYDYTRRESNQIMVCVDRAIVTNGDHGNCIIVNANPNLRVIPPEPQYRVINADGSITNGTEVALASLTQIVIREDFFSRNWRNDGQPRTVEIFSITNQPFNLDNMTVVDATTPLTPGVYEEYSTAFTYYEAQYDAGTHTFSYADNGWEILDLTLDPVTRLRINDFGTDWTYDNRTTSLRDSGGAVMQTFGVGNAIRFELNNAVGFAPRFRIDALADSVRVCWLQGAGQSVSDVLASDNPNCQNFDNGIRGTFYGVPRPILGLDATQTYTAAVQFLGDNSLPTANARQTEVRFDGVEILSPDNFNWQSLNTLTTGIRNETNFNNRVANNQFVYFGGNAATWFGFSGTAARLQSNLDYDVARRTISAGIVFKTNNANAVILYRDVRTNYSDWLVCATPTASLGNPYCSYVSNKGGVGYQIPATVSLNASGASGEHIVTIYTLEPLDSAFDAIQPINRPTLTVGMYDDNHPAITYGNQANNLVWNGHMEAEHFVNNGIEFWRGNNINALTSSTLRYADRRSLQVDANSGGYVESLPFSLQAGTTYTVTARVYFSTATSDMTLSLQGAGGTPSTTLSDALDRPTIVNAIPLRKWQTLTFQYTPGVDENDVRVRITSDNNVIFFLDDVSVIEGSTWSQEIRATFYGGSRTVSRSYGATAIFNFTGTGFSIGTELNRTGGEMQVCYAGGAIDECITYSNESAAARAALRTISGLPLNTYSVTIRDVEDGYTTLRNLNDEPRVQREAVGQLVIDFIEVYDTTAPDPIMDAGIYDDTARTNGVSNITTLPSRQWLVNTTAVAARFFNSSYTSLAIDGRDSVVTAGGSLLLTLKAEEATLVLYTTEASARMTDSVLVCAGAPDGNVRYEYDPVLRRANYSLDNSNNCILANNLRDNNIIVLGSDKLTGGSNQTVSITPLGIGEFKLDRYQVFYGSEIAPGYYEDTLMSSLLNTPPNNLTGTWSTVANRLFTSQTAYVSTTPGVVAAQFDIVDATGISLVTLFDRNGGSIKINVSGTDLDLDFYFDTYSPTPLYNQSLTVAGLPLDDYTVIITKENYGGLDSIIDKHFIIDAIQVYGQLTQLGSLYDDAQTDLDGNLLLNYGPELNTWTRESGIRARGYLNETYHLADSVGANIAFRVGSETKGIRVYYGATSTTADVQVCWTDLDTLPVPDPICTTEAFNDRAGVKFIASPFWNDGTKTSANSAVTITNQQMRGRLFFDAVQITKDFLAEGIYDVGFLNANGNLFDMPSVLERYNLLANAVTLSDSDYVQFNMTGIGFSAIFSETAATADRYQLCVSSGHNANSCNVMNETIFRAASPTRDFALTKVGMHNGTGNGEFTVRITNPDSARSVNLNSVHILGAGNTAFKIDGSAMGYERIENTSPYIRYFPFNSYTEQVDARGILYSGTPSSQHFTLLRGAGVYFEFNNVDSFQYGLQTNPAHGDLQINVGVIGTNIGDGTFYSDPTNQPNATQVARSMFMADCKSDANGCWVFIQNTKDDARRTTFDFATVFDSTAPLRAGWYEDTFPSLQDFDNAGTINPINAGEVASPRSSAGLVREYRADGIGNALNGGMFFSFEGTGFSTYITEESFADVINVCYQLASEFSSISNLLTSDNCQTFDNFNLRINYTQPRRVVGLPYGVYNVAIQMIDSGRVRNIRQVPIRMQIDAIEVHSDSVANLRTLEPGNTYETSYDNRAGDSLFQYYGSTWRSLVGAAANLYSGRNYDLISQNGAGIVFRTNGGNAISLLTFATARTAPALFCATPVNGSLEATGARYCRILETQGRNVYQAPITFLLGGTTTASTDGYIVSITSLTLDRFFLDAIKVFDATAPLSAGYYEQTDPRIVYNGNWIQEYLPRFSGASAANSKESGASAQFTFTGTGFSIGLPEHRLGGEVRICYAAGTNTPDPATDSCFTYQQENLRVSYNTERNVIGLPSGTYTVSVTDVEDGFTVTRRGVPTFPRAANAPIGEIQLDYVRIYDEPFVSPIAPGYYDDAVQDDILLLPPDVWVTTAGRVAIRFTQSTYTAPSLNNRVSNIYAGTTFNTQVEVSDVTTVILHTGTPNRSSSQYLLACVGEAGSGIAVDGIVSWDGLEYSLVGSDSCTLLNSSMRLLSTSTIAIGGVGTDPSNQNSGRINVPAGTYNLMVTTLDAGFFYLDGYQVIDGNILSAGSYGIFLPDNLLDFDNSPQPVDPVTFEPIETSINRNPVARLCNLATEWCVRKDARAYGGEYAITSNIGASLNFTFEGTGFSIVTLADTLGTPMRICYAANGAALPTNNDAINGFYNDDPDVLCSVVTTDTNIRYTDDWDNLNRDRINPRIAAQYGFSFYGMPFNTYNVQVKMLQSSYYRALSNTLKIDAVHIFSDASTLPVMDGGMYQNDSGAIRYESSINWLLQEYVALPTRGPLGRTDHITTNAGAIAQMRITGNGLIIYQTRQARGSAEVRMCLVESDEVTAHCDPNVNNLVGGDSYAIGRYSQRGAQSFAMPVMFYGFGSGSTKTVILENRDAGFNFTIDAIQVQP